MAATPRAGHLAGFYYAQIMFRDTNGYPVGSNSTPNSKTNGTVYNAYKLTGPVNVTAPTPTRELATFRGGMAILGQRALGTTDFGTFDLTLSAYDEVFESYVTGAVNDATNAGTENIFSASNTENLNLPQFHLVLTAGWQDSTGTNRYMNWMYPNVQIAPGQISVTQDGGVNPNPVQYTVIPSSSTRTTLGYLFSATTVGITNDRDIVSRWRTDYPVTFATYIDDGADTSVTTAYKPATSDVDGSRNVYTKNGVDNKANISAFSTSTGATTHTAGSATDVWIISYMTNWITP